MTYAAAVARAKYEEQVFKFKDEPEEQPVVVVPVATLAHWQAGFEFFQVYFWLRDKYTVL